MRRDAVLICRDCSQRAQGGFGPDGKATLGQALRRYQKPTPGRDHPLKVVMVGCLGVCPDRAVIALNAADPKRMVAIPTGSDLLEVRAHLSLPHPRRRRAVSEAAMRSQDHGSLSTSAV